MAKPASGSNPANLCSIRHMRGANPRPHFERVICLYVWLCVDEHQRRISVEQMIFETMSLFYAEYFGKPFLFTMGKDFNSYEEATKDVTRRIKENNPQNLDEIIKNCLKRQQGFNKVSTRTLLDLS